MKKESILTKYINVANKLNRWPSRVELLKVGLTRDRVRHHYGSYGELKRAALKKDKSLKRLEIFTDELHKENLKKIKSHSTFVITTAVAGAPVHKPFFNSLKTFCKHNNALLLIIPSNYQLYEMDPIVSKEAIVVFRTIHLNSNVSVNPIKIDPKQVDPAQGLEAIVKKEKTIIIGSPKQRRKSIPNGPSLATIIQSSGAVTRPRYIPKDGIPKRRDTLAHTHHVMGAIVVEIENDEFFHFRNIEMSPGGGFWDNFKYYHSSGVKVEGNPKALVLGDYHVTETDQEVKRITDLMVKKSKPSFVVFHDFFSGVSINHHEEGNFTLQARKASEGKLSLEAELKACVAEIKEKLKLYPKETKLVFVKSNHDEFLNRYLSRGNFEPHNRTLALELSIRSINGEDPLVAGFKKFGLTKEDLRRIIFLPRENMFRVAGVYVGAHGDIGFNGQKNPGIKSIYKAYGKSVTGHTHTAEIWHEAMSVGTSSKLKLGYNIGPSTWIHCHCVIYEDGTRQLINIVNGKYTTQK